MREADDRSTYLGQRMLEGVEALRGQRWADAVEPLREVTADEELALAEDLRDIRARACTLLAQALIRSGGGATEAEGWLDEAAALLRALDDEEGLAEVARLRRERTDALGDAARQAQIRGRLETLAATPLDEVRARAPSPEALQQLLVQKANAEIEAGRPEAAVPIAEEALDLAVRARSIRGEVMARMSIARAAPERASKELKAAWRRAERANEFNLVGAVARAAAAASVELPRMVGPQMGSKR